MTTPLQRFVADHKFILNAVGESAGLIDPVAVDLDDLFESVMSRAIRGPVLSLDGVLIRDWDQMFRKTWPGVKFGVRLYHLEGIRFARATANVNDQLAVHGYNFFAVQRQDYHRFYRTALKLQRQEKPVGSPPLLPQGHIEVLRRNTIDYLNRKNLQRIKEYGARARRGILLTGPPGNGKTSACRWIFEECLRANYQYRFVTADDYRSARSSPNATEEIRNLFQFEKPGIVFFDDMDVALRDRETTNESDDQSVFLSSMDGIESKEGVVYVFTTNCDVKLIDPAFKRPGRLDIVLNFPKPERYLREKLLERWHKDIRAAVPVEQVLNDTEGMSYAEIEELKNVLVLHYIESDTWDWAWSVQQYHENRSGLGTNKKDRILGFLQPATNGVH